MYNMIKLFKGGVKAVHEQWQTILILKGIAGKLTLFGQTDPNGHWIFYHQNDAQLKEATSEHVHSFIEALSLLGQSWKYLQPEYIHPQFKKALWDNIHAEKGLFNRTTWRRACL